MSRTKITPLFKPANPAKPTKVGAMPTKRTRVAKNGPVRIYRPAVSDVQGVLAKGQGNKVNAPTAVAFESFV